MRERVSEMRAIGRDALLSVEAAHSAALLHFRDSAAVRERLETIIAAEAECCAFLGFTLTDAPDVLVLTVRAPEAGRQVVHELAAAFSGEA